MMYFGKNVTTAITVAQARGVILLALAEAGLTIREYKPAEIKQAIAGYGDADKVQMQEMIRQLLDLDEIPRPGRCGRWARRGDHRSELQPVRAHVGVMGWGKKRKNEPQRTQRAQRQIREKRERQEKRKG